MKTHLFQYEEAEAKRGTRVCTRVTLIGIPKGTTGTVHRVEQTVDGCLLIVQWDLPLSPNRTRRPDEDWFSKDDYAAYLVEEGIKRP